MCHFGGCGNKPIVSHKGYLVKGSWERVYGCGTLAGVSGQASSASLEESHKIFILWDTLNEV